MRMMATTQAVAVELPPEEDAVTDARTTMVPLPLPGPTMSVGAAGMAAGIMAAGIMAAGMAAGGSEDADDGGGRCAGERDDDGRGGEAGDAAGGEAGGVLGDADGGSGDSRSVGGRA